MQILIVEDEAKIRHLLRRGLLEESYAVDTAEDGEEALYKLDINEYDLVLLDIMLPKVNGIAECKAVREKGSHLPVILLTAKDRVTDKVLGLDAGAVGIAPEHQARIFDRFYRIDAARSETQGYGLGLAIAQAIVALHNGKIRVHSALGKGTTISLYLPLA